MYLTGVSGRVTFTVIRGGCAPIRGVGVTEVQVTASGDDWPESDLETVVDDGGLPGWCYDQDPTEWEQEHPEAEYWTAKAAEKAAEEAAAIAAYPSSCVQCQRSLPGRVIVCPDCWCNRCAAKRPREWNAPQPEIGHGRWCLACWAETLCTICGAKPRAIRNRCRTCDMYYRRHGYERPAHLHSRQADLNRRHPRGDELTTRIADVSSAYET
jgi:hypothetical protein